MKKNYQLLFLVTYSATAPAQAKTAPAAVVVDSHATSLIADANADHSRDHSADLSLEIPTIHYIKTFEFEVIPLPYRDLHARDSHAAAAVDVHHRVLSSTASVATGTLPLGTSGYGMKVDFTISRENAGDNTQFNVITGIYPPDNYSWVSGRIYQSYIQFAGMSEQGTKNNVVCDAIYSSNPLLRRFNERTSCGTIDLSTLSLSKKYSDVKGESTAACADLWTLDPLSNFFVDSDGLSNCLCSYSRSFQVGTGVNLKVGSVLTFTAGFNEFASSTTVGALAYGKSNQWSWTVTDSSSYAFVSLLPFISYCLFTF